MKKNLPENSLSSLKSSRLVQAATLELPRIYRFITEKVITFQVFSMIKVVILASITAALFLAILFQGYILSGNLKRIDRAAATRGKLITEVQYWKQITTQYGGYRDANFRIASLEYALGNTTEAKKFVEKTLQIDPNFEPGYALGGKVGISR